MRIFAVSDIHMDYKENQKWFKNLSHLDYNRDVIILAGDISDDIRLICKTFEGLKRRFRKVAYVPGNHDLWVQRDRNINSIEKFLLLKTTASEYGVHMEPLIEGSVMVVPLFGWYDFSFGIPSDESLTSWMDFYACKWPPEFDEKRITEYFISMNKLNFSHKFVISFSHFVPRIDLMPDYIPSSQRILYPVLGSWLLEKQIRLLKSSVHVYGHSHVNRQVVKDNTLYINNAYGYPYETAITSKKLKCIFET